MKRVFAAAMAGTLVAAPALADDSDKAAIQAARQLVSAALGDDCADDPKMYGDDPYFADTAIRLDWRTDWGDDTYATLYSIFCFQGAYNTGRAYAIKPKDLPVKLVSFAEPKLEFEYTDENDTALKAPPTVVGFTTTSLLINPEFQAVDASIVSQSRWRGLGDAWSSGTWFFDKGAFVLKQYDVDPTYDANLENPDEDAMEKFYTVYKAEGWTGSEP